MSNSESLSDFSPSDAALKEALQGVVQEIYESQKVEDLTVKRVRIAAEKRLGLQQDFFKDHPVWKDRSKDIIQAEVDAHPEASSQASPPKKSTAKSSSNPSTKAAEAKPRAKSQKRSSAGEAGPKKRRKTGDSNLDISSSKDQHRQPKHTDGKAKRSISPSHSPAQDLPDENEPDEPEEQGESTPNGNGALGSESEMSVLLDEEPKRKVKRRSGGFEKSKPKNSGTSKGSKPDAPADPNLEEIKRLQGWLVKCGIRKMWYKELQPYETPKAKIRHLKEMLSDAGMGGRYSNERASQIREERELKADLEAVQAGDKHWGKAGSENEGTGRPKRRLAKGLENLDFLNDDDGEETD